MRGSPLLRAFLVFLAILALGWPLRRLTGTDDGPAASPTAATPLVREVHLQVTFTTAPTHFSVRHLGREVWSDQGGGTQAERKLQLPYPKEGVELQFAADFPDGAPLAAARLTLTDPQGDAHEKSCWGSGHIDEVVAFP
jgi:hypothetical protein